MSLSCLACPTILQREHCDWSYQALEETNGKPQWCVAQCSLLYPLSKTAFRFLGYETWWNILNIYLNSATCITFLPIQQFFMCLQSRYRVPIFPPVLTYCSSTVISHSLLPDIRQKLECRARFVSSTHADHDFSARAVATRPTRWETEVGFELDLEPRGWKENSGIFFLKRPDLPAHPSLPPKTSQAVAPLLRYLSPWMMDEAAVLNSYSSEWAPVERRWGIVVPAGCRTPTSTPGDAWRGGECAFSLQEYGI